ncbi:glycoside hydrolase family 5 protein [Aquicella lusitana]|uniref:Endoglucanase n=1 Tax=Aquicella lusitana TaxID=254246 RepID=A0A370GNA7_9COXI|nr:glycoside hydrolase family 5 protein [Aquicella lusitana]RDI43403.1 endoglucanase [Aquicella lusitana]VVC73553.1 Endoglucanase E-5 [Aquicella lusitana]
MKAFFSLGAVLFFLSPVSFANIPQHITPQSTSCIGAQFSSTGDNYWKNIILKLSNHCGKAVDFQNATVTFQATKALNTSFWGTFSPLPYPDNDLRITSQALPEGNFLATLNLHFPTYPGANTNLPADHSIYIKYGAATDNHIEGTTQVYLGSPVETGNIELTSRSSKPANVSQDYALVHITMNGQKISDINLPWLSSKVVSGLVPGSYAISADNVTDTGGNTYQSMVNPSTVHLSANQTASVIINYALLQPTGKITIKLQALPAELAGYTAKPTIQLTESGTGSATPVTVDWNMSLTVSQLKKGSTYSFSTPVINYNGFQCQPAFHPATLVANDPAPVAELTYSCSRVVQASVTVNVNGAPATLPSLNVTFTPNNNANPVTQTVTLNNGSGTSTVMLTAGLIYQVSSDPVPDYSIHFNPQPLTATDNQIETISLSQQAGTPVSINGRLKVCGTKLCNEHNVPIQLKGMSTHGLQWYGWNKCVTPASLDALTNDFKASVVRASLYVQEGGYETDPVGFTNQVNQIIEEATQRGVYVIVDWHILSPGDPNYNLTRAQKFFTDIATAHKGKKNLIYEIANEPNGVSWSTIKSYADKLIPVIRSIDPDTVILVGTAGWSSLGISDGRSSQDIINQPVTFPNIMYTFHFYAASHREVYLNELDKASNVLPIFVTEFGTQTYSGDGTNDFVMSDKYIQLMSQKKISWTNWNYSDDFRSGAIWKTGTCSGGPWTDTNLKPAGIWIKDKIKN